MRTPSFLVLWLGSLVSLTGDWILLTGLPLVVYRLTGSTLALGATAMAGALPRVLVASMAGVFVDRWDRRRTMLVSNLLMAAGLAPLLIATSIDRLWLAAPVLLIVGSVAQFYKPAEAALLPSLVDAADLPSANALNGLTQNVARLCGPAIGAWLATSGGLEQIALVDAVSFLVAAATLGLVRSRLATPSAASAEHPWRMWLDGLRAVRAQRLPRVLVGFLAITGLGEGVMATLMVPFATRVMQGSELTYGALVSAQAVGGIVGSAVCAQVAGRLSAARLLGISALLVGGIDLLIFYAPLLTASILVPLGLMVLVGLPAAGLTPGYLTLIQTSVPDGQRGRVLGAGFASLAATGLVGMLAAGWLGDHVGILPLLTVQSAVYLIGGAIVLWQLEA